jgi:hypothetical protein
MECLLTFPNVHYAIQSEKLLLAKNIAVTVVALPASLGDFCGVCLRIAKQDLTKSHCLLEEAKLSVKAIYTIEKEGRERKYQLWQP